MVDFQSRDTRRGPTDEDEADEDAATDEAEPSGDAGPDSAVETADDASGEPDGDERDTADEGTATDTADDGTATDTPDGGTATDTTDPLADDTADPGTPDGRDAPDPDDTTDDPLADAEPTPGETTTARSDAAESPADVSGGTTDTRDTPGSDDGRTGPGSAVGGPAGKSVGPAADTATPEPTRSVAVAVVTVGADDGVEDAVASAFEGAGHAIAVRERLRGNYDTVQQVVDRLVDRADVDVVVTVGGIGIEQSEITIEAVHPLFEKALPGFGEAFRTLLFDHIGTGIVAVRSAAGIADGTFVFCLPGDPEAATLAVEEILATEAPELVAHLDE